MVKVGSSHPQGGRGRRAGFCFRLSQKPNSFQSLLVYELELGYVAIAQQHPGKCSLRLGCLWRLQGKGSVAERTKGRLDGGGGGAVMGSRGVSLNSDS